MTLFPFTGPPGRTRLHEVSEKTSGGLSFRKILCNNHLHPTPPTCTSDDDAIPSSAAKFGMDKTPICG